MGQTGTAEQAAVWRERNQSASASRSVRRDKVHLADPWLHVGVRSYSKRTTSVGYVTHVYLRFLVRERFAIRYRPSVSRLSVCNVRAPYSAGCNFRQFFFAVWYLCHPLTSTEKFTEIVPEEPFRRGGLNARGVAKYSDFLPLEYCISDTVQDKR